MLNDDIEKNSENTSEENSLLSFLKKEDNEIKSEEIKSDEIPSDEKRGRGRHPKECNCEKCVKRREEKQSEFSNTSKDAKEFGEFLGEISEFSLEFINERLPNPKPVTPSEIKFLNKALNRIGTKYFDKFGKWNEEIGILIALSFFILPRIKKSEVKNTDEKI